jgi:hypothetical protein
MIMDDEFIIISGGLVLFGLYSTLSSTHANVLL